MLKRDTDNLFWSIDLAPDTLDKSRVVPAPFREQGVDNEFLKVLDIYSPDHA
jgi:hypothetical protein